MIKLYTEEFDNALISKINHFNNYPELLPFIGNKWNNSPVKYLLIAESHYIDHGAISEKHEADWYNFSSKDFIWKDYLNSIYTRLNVIQADDINTFGFKSPYTHYYNIKKEIKNNFIELQQEEFVYPFLSYYNYFQRPAFQDGTSIENNTIDDDKAYSTFKYLVDIIEPDKIIFISNKSFSSFLNQSLILDERNLFKNYYGVPHPGSAWWNRRSKNYGTNSVIGKYRTGRERFVDIITSKI